MKILLSPAKTLDFEKAPSDVRTAEPLFAAKAKTINAALRKYDMPQLQKLQGISPALAEVNFERNAQWETGKGAAPALYVFQGDVYQGLQAREWNPEDVEFAERHLRILSGLYGMLRPTDTMMPYRLEMGTKLAVNGAANLYQYWKEPLQRYMEEHWGREELIVNLASKEYFKVIDQLSLPQPVLHFAFKDYSKGQYKVIPYYAKIARGLMARHIVQNRLKTVEDFKSFDTDGYYFSSSHSTPEELVFLRDKHGK